MYEKLLEKINEYFLNQDLVTVTYLSTETDSLYINGYIVDFDKNIIIVENEETELVLNIHCLDSIVKILHPENQLLDIRDVLNFNEYYSENKVLESDLNRFLNRYG